jgi:glucose-6-phosphate isomerase
VGLADVELELRHARIPAVRLRRYSARLRSALRELDAGRDGDFLRAVSDRRLLGEIRGYLRRRPPGMRDVVQLGIGGSSLGARALCSALVPPGSPGRGLRFHCPDNVDPEGFGALLDQLDPRRTLVHVVSKSGGTLETLAQLHVLLAHWRLGPGQIARQVVVTTGESGPLREFADAHGTAVLSAPPHVSGRFSVLTASGLLLPALCGVPLERVLAGARAMERLCRRQPLVGPAGRLAALHYEHDQKSGRPIHVELIYSDALLPLGEWFRQIWAESLGKQGRGPTPLVARGTTDQHSQIQLYVDGPDDKLYTALLVENPRRDLRVPRRAEPDYIRGRTLAEIFAAEARGTLEALIARGRPVIELRLRRITPEAIGALLLLQQLQTALAGPLYGVYPFDQPGVEAGKEAAARILRRKRRPSAPWGTASGRGAGEPGASKRAASRRRAKQGVPRAKPAAGPPKT